MFCHARFDGVAHLGHGRSAADTSARHGGELVGRLDEASLFHHLLAALDGDAVSGEHRSFEVVHLIDGDPGVRSAVFADHLGNFVSPSLGDFCEPVAGEEVGRAGCGPHFVNIVVVASEELAVVVVPQDDIAVGRHEPITSRIMHDPQLHVGGVGDVADVHRVHHEHPVVTKCAQLFANTLLSVGPDDVEIGQFESCSLVLGDRLAARTQIEVMVRAGSQCEFWRAIACAVCAGLWCNSSCHPLILADLE